MVKAACPVWVQAQGTLVEEAMHVGVIHHIHDPEGFQRAEAEAMQKGLPAEFGLPVQAATPDHRTSICIWQGPSVDAVRELVESVVAPYSRNEYFEVNLETRPV
jgi:hypothetical protein